MRLTQTLGGAWMRVVSPVLRIGSSHEATAKALRAARIGTFPEWYVAVSYLAASLAAVPLALGAWIMLGVLGFLEPGVPRGLLAATAGAGGFLLVRLGFLAYPRVRAAGRARRIDKELPAVVVLCYALARGGMNTLDVFRAVKEERETYGEASVEFGVVVRNVDWLGLDLVSALQHGAETTPSLGLRGFYEGLTSILNSGADPQAYFRNQAETQLVQGEMDLEKDLEQASLLAEVYVSGLLVLPLLLIVVLSGLAPLGGGGEAFIPLIAFGLIPAGTGAYVILVETMMPPDSLLVPKVERPERMDFGVDSVPAGAAILPPPWKMSASDLGVGEGADRGALARARWLRLRLWAERVRERVGAARRRFFARMIAKPVDALEFSGFVALGVAAVGGWIAWTRGVRGAELGVLVTGVLVVAGLCAMLPVSLFHEIRVRRARKVEQGLPDALSKLAGFNERGIGLLQAFMILGRSSSGPLASELRAVERDVSWNGNLAGALRRLRERVSTVTMTKLAILLERASRATGNLKEVLHIAATDAAKTENLRSRKRQAMVSYVIVIYIVFAVFLYVVYMVANMFYGEGGFGAVAANAGSTGGALSRGLDPADAKVLFMQASVVQGVCSGLVAGRLGEGHVLSGLKHAMIMGLAAWAIFALGVLG